MALRGCLGTGDRRSLFDLTERKFYIFGWVFWPQDVLYLTFILIVSAYALFLCDRDRGSRFLWLRVPADGVHRSVHVDRERSLRVTAPLE
jgi:hypothetical protein